MHLPFSSSLNYTHSSTESHRLGGVNSLALVVCGNNDSDRRGIVEVISSFVVVGTTRVKKVMGKRSGVKAVAQTSRHGMVNVERIEDRMFPMMLSAVRVVVRNINTVCGVE